MKKLLSFLLTGIMVFGSTVVGFGAEAKPTVMTEVCEIVIDELDEDMHGGLYYEDDILHIKPVDESAVQAVVQMVEQETRSFNSEIVVDDVAKYTYTELKTAKDTVFDNREELGVYATGISSKNNSIRVIAEQWTDDMKETVYDVAGIDNVMFEIKETGNQVSLERVIDEDETNARATQPLAAGTRIYGGGGSRTLTASAIMYGEEGFVTAGHLPGDPGEKLLEEVPFETRDGKKIGKVMKSYNSGSVDFAFIKRQSDSIHYLTRDLLLNPTAANPVFGKIKYARTPVEGAVALIGYASGFRTSKIIDTSYNTSNAGANSDLLLFLPDTKGNPGDSGGPVLFSISGNDYAICGLWKGFAGPVGDDTEPLGVRWDNIRNNYDVQLY